MYINPKIKKDILIRKNFAVIEVKRNFLRSILEDSFLEISQRRQISIILFNFVKKNHSLTNVRNRCVVTSRTRAVYRLFRLSRTPLKNSISYGNIPGVKKSS